MMSTHARSHPLPSQTQQQLESIPKAAMKFRKWDGLTARSPRRPGSGVSARIKGLLPGNFKPTCYGSAHLCKPFQILKRLLQRASREPGATKKSEADLQHKGEGRR